MSDLTLDEADTLGRTIQEQSWDTPFTLDAHGAVAETTDPFMVPEVYNSDEHDVTIMGDWKAMTGLTGQYGYRGAVMHTSEFIAGGIAEAMLDLVQDSGKPFLTFAVTEVRDETGDYPEDAIGWAIIYTGDES